MAARFILIMNLITKAVYCYQKNFLMRFFAIIFKGLIAFHRQMSECFKYDEIYFIVTCLNGVECGSKCTGNKRKIT